MPLFKSLHKKQDSEPTSSIDISFFKIILSSNFFDNSWKLGIPRRDTVLIGQALIQFTFVPLLLPKSFAKYRVQHSKDALQLPIKPYSGMTY